MNNPVEKKYEELNKNVIEEKKTVEQFLSDCKTDDDQQNSGWLDEYKKGDDMSVQEILNSGSRILYYPGAGFDGQPVESCNRARYADVFIYADYAMKKTQLKDEIKTRGFKGYHLLDEKNLTKEDLNIAFWEHHFDAEGKDVRFSNPFWAQAMIFERNDDVDANYGNNRFVFIYVCMDGIALYDALFANTKRRPDMLVLQDHGFGLNYDLFGRGGYMEETAEKTGVYPHIILCADNTDVWDGYEMIKEVLPVKGGMHNHYRNLFRKRYY